VAHLAQATLPQASTATLGVGKNPATGLYRLKGSVIPDGLPTQYVIQWGGSAESLPYSTAVAEVGSGYAAVAVSTEVSWYDSAHGVYRIVATNAEGTTFSPVKTFNVGIGGCSPVAC
jgi:hypothetical protein